MPVYKFPFPVAAASADVTVRDASGTEVNTGTIGSSPEPSGEIIYHATLDEGDYFASTPSPWVHATVVHGGETEPAAVLEVRGILDVVDSIAAGGGVGAAETAYFVATSPADVTDGAGAAGNLTFVADARHGALPSWASIVSGDVVLSEDAGTCAWAFTGLFDYDFSTTTPPDSDGAILSPFSAVNPVGTTPISADDVGDGQDDQTSPAARAGGITLPGTFTVVGLPIAYSDDQITPIPDGTATPRVALTVTRIAQAAVLPE